MAELDKLIEAIAKDDAAVSNRALSDVMRILVDRMELLEVIMAPKNQDRMFRNPFQRKLINPGQEDEVYRQEVPSGFIGVVTSIGNTFFTNTFYTRVIDNRQPEPKIQRSIAPVDAPLPVKIFLKDRMIWRATNSDGAPHTFEVVADGFFIPEDIADRIADVEG